MPPSKKKLLSPAPPTDPGCYIMRDARQRVIYVGKAKNIRRRVSSYFQKNHADPKTVELVKHVASLEYITTRNEVEALILESRLIKQYQPQYNIDLKENQPYAYIKLTDEEYPRLVSTRMVTPDGSYFGPFTSARGRRALMRTTARLFNIRLGKLTSRSSRELNRLLSISREQKLLKLSRREYASNVRLAELFLRGQKDSLLDIFEERMRQAAASENFELAKLYRDQVRAIRLVNERQLVDLPKRYDQDVMNLAPAGESSIIQVFHITRGVVTTRDRYQIQSQHTTPADVLNEFLSQYYLTRPLPPEIIVPFMPADQRTLTASWQTLTGTTVRLLVPQRGDKRALLELVRNNILASIRHDPLLELQAALALSTVPREIDAFDISNISGTNAVGSCVRFTDGTPNKDLYRRFKIKTVRGSNDFAMMKEVVGRRYRREGSDGGERAWGLPDLILIDGGKGQLSVALRALKTLGLTVPIISLAKKREEVYLPGRSEPFRWSSTSPARKLLQQLRDEAHRFAVSYHTKLRQKAVRR